MYDYQIVHNDRYGNSNQLNGNIQVMLVLIIFFLYQLVLVLVPFADFYLLIMNQKCLYG